VTYIRSGQTTATTAQPSANAWPSPSRRASRYIGTAASDIASECSAWVSRYAIAGSWNSQNGDASRGSSSAGKWAGPPRTSGFPVSASERAIAE